jgi:2-oxoglutarate dehydrogenase E1 component
MKDFQFITSAHPSYIENLYKDFVENPESVDPELKKFFQGFDFAVTAGSAPVAVNGSAPATGNLLKEFAVYALILGYKHRGHLLAEINPLKKRKDHQARLNLSDFNLSDADLDTAFEAGNFIGLGKTSLRNILQFLQKTYCGHVGVEFMYIRDKEKLDFLTQAIEKTFHEPVPVEQKKRILQKLNQGVMFEKFLHTKYVGQKRFSLEGGENTITALDAIIQTAAEQEVEEIVIGMAHRGRLNVLANIMGKTYEQIFKEFEGDSPADSTMGSGDVKYHLGFSSEVETLSGKKMNLKLTPNPSHLEAVAPVVWGFARSKADLLYNQQYSKVLPIIIHGDASVAGQGVVYEGLQMSQLKGYHVGGTIHYVINNQIGFTTDLDDARSATYCTSLASMVEAPVFHVNGDDAEAVVKVAQIATAFRNKFKSDIFIDMVCYRRHGHNEGDEPKFTQPQMYGLIDKHPNPREVYTHFLMENGEPDAKELAREMEKDFVQGLQERLDEVKQKRLPYTYQQPEKWWQSLRKATPEDFVASPVTAISKEELMKYFNALMEIPEGFKPLRKVDKLLQDKIKLLNAEGKIDWATGELLAYGSLLAENKNVRMSGQDVKRGTFSHRHAVLYDENTNDPYFRVNNVAKETGQTFKIYNSLLSEFAVLAFEYGYAMANPNSLVLWEAQFGDFANGAQTITDQFIAAAEQKWQRMNGMVMLLPHGYEGQGPEHSSARLERFLQQSAELNIIVTNVTTAANFFHVLRRQLAWPFRKPLINFSPKANLRHPDSYSKLEAFTEGGFREVYDDENVNPEEITKVLLCSGKVYFDLDDRRKKDDRKDVAIIRLEQIHPLPQQQLDALYEKYNKAIWYWVQEEPLNMGAAAFLRMNLQHINFHIVSRKARAAVASGYAKVHGQEQEELIETAFTI